LAITTVFGQNVATTINELYRPDPASDTFTLTGQVQLDRFNPEGHGFVDHDVFIVLQVLSKSDGTWPAFYDRFDPAARCYAGANGCLSDAELRGSHVRAKVLFHHRFSETQEGTAVPLAVPFALPPDMERARIVSHHARTINNPPWLRPEQRFSFAVVQEWPRGIPVNIRNSTAGSPPVSIPPATSPPSTTSAASTREAVTFVNAQVTSRNLVVELKFPANLAGTLLSASLSTVDNPQPFQQVRFIVGNAGVAEAKFRAKPTGWDPVNHRIKIFREGEELGERIVDFSNLNKTGVTKLPF
jgi:hypothetical protein